MGKIKQNLVSVTFHGVNCKSRSIHSGGGWGVEGVMLKQQAFVEPFTLLFYNDSSP